MSTSWIEKLEALQADLDNGSDGLGALKTLLDAIPTTMVGTDSAALASVLGALDTAAATGAVSTAKLVMAYVKQLITEGIARDTAIGNIPTTMRGTDSAATVADGWDSALAIILDNFTATRIGYLDELDFDLTAAIAAIPTTMVGTNSAMLATSGARVVLPLHFKSDLIPLITIDATAGNEVLAETVTVRNIPAGATLVEVTAWVSISGVSDTSVAENYLLVPSAEHIQVKETSAGTYVDAIALKNAMLVTPSEGHSPGIVLWGNIDIKAEVDANGEYTFQIENADAFGGNLLLRGVHCGLIVWYSL